MNPSTARPMAREFAEAAEIAGQCYYELTVERGPAYPSLNGQLSVDVGVVGAGFAGLSAALELAQRGYSVALLEAQRIAAAASGRNGGQILPGFSCDIGVIQAQLGQAGARRAWDLSIEGMAIVKDRALGLGIDCEYTPGWALFAARPGHVQKLRDWRNQLERDLGYGAHVEFIDASELHRWTASTAYHAALIDHHAGHLNPLKLALAMSAACQALGVQIFENTPVLEVVRGRAPALAAPTGRVNCKKVVMAANVFGNSFDLPMRNRVMSIGNTIIATEPLPAQLAERLLPGRYAACDTNFLLDYYRITADHRMLWGGGSTYLRHDVGNRIQALQEKMVATFPDLRGFGVECAWGGLIDATLSRAPDFGRIDEEIYYLQGFSGHGVNVTAIAGRLAAEAIAGQPERFDLLAGLKHRKFPAVAWVRRAGLALGASFYQLRDVWS